MLLVVAVVASMSAACTRSADGSDATAAATVPDPPPASGDSGSTLPLRPGTTAETDSDADTAPTAPASPATSVVSSVPSSGAPAGEPTTPIPVEEVPEVGVPGLDSTDAFCAAWSRFAGSFQVVAVTAAFGSGIPEQLAALEIAAAPTVTDAYDELISNWPDELSSEADVVADQFLGPFARRLGSARDSLVATGADEATITAISEAWVAGLAQRDPSTPEFVVDLPDEVWEVIDGAAQDFSTRLVPFGSDPSLVSDVDTPLTRAYLAVSCPDQGTLSGQEVDTP